jgi:nitrogen regulatory protein PII
MPKTIGLTLVTIITPAEFADRLEEDLRRLGAGGYTMSNVSGQGQRRPRWHGWLSTGNVRIETLITSEVAARVLDHVADLADLRVLAFAHSVEAVPIQRFAKVHPPGT